jgi:hypothetical protein
MQVKTRWMGWAGVAAALVLAGAVRFHDLSRSAVRSDEINFMSYVARGQSLVDLWRTPPWFNQIPLADSIPIVWSRLTGQAASEGMIRQPFALLGWLTVAFCTAWMIRRRGWCAGLLLGGWMAVLPYHVYHSREAYYYVLVMFFAAGMVLRGADFMVRRKVGVSLRVHDYVEWTVWALLTCLSHMSAWVVVGVAWCLLVTAGFHSGPSADRKRHALAMGVVAVAMGLGIIRWVLRALYEMKRAAADSSVHIGVAFDFVGPRVLPFFAGGANAVGVGLLALVVAAAVWIGRKSRWRIFRDDPLYTAMTGMTFLGLLGSYAYIFAAGGGDKAKLTYFSANLPTFLVWAAMTIDQALASLDERTRIRVTVAAVAVLAAMLLVPAWQVTQLTGKPTPYRLLRDWLDNNLPAGEVVVVDRWLEPWNEMALYAPSNVTVTFTVPDEPYEAAYVANRWRETTQAAFEQNEAQAFLRLSRNHEERVGLWKWPEKWFAHRAVVTNEAAVWLRDTGFAPMEEYYTQTNRVMPEIFYNTRAERAERAAAAGQKSILFFGAGWRLFKPWPQGDFANYQLLEHEASVMIYNLTGQAGRFRGEMVAAGAGGPVAVQVNDSEALSFPANRLTTQTFDIELAAGENAATLRVVEPGATLVVRRIWVTPQL